MKMKEKDSAAQMVMNYSLNEDGSISKSIDTCKGSFKNAESLEKITEEMASQLLPTMKKYGEKFNFAISVKKEFGDIKTSACKSTFKVKIDSVKLKEEGIKATDAFSELLVSALNSDFDEVVIERLPADKIVIEQSPAM